MPAGGINLESRRRVCGSPRSRGGPAGDQPGPVLLRDRGRAPATQHVIVLVVVALGEAESTGPAPGEGSPRLSVSRLRVRTLSSLLSALLFAGVVGEDIHQSLGSLRGHGPV